MGKRIYVGNLPWSVTKEGLEKLFSSYGEMEDALVIANKYTGRSRGFGFITFKNDEDADKAIKEMEGKEVEGRALVVKEARPLREDEQEKDDSSKADKEEENTGSVDAKQEEIKTEVDNESEKASEVKAEVGVKVNESENDEGEKPNSENEKDSEDN